MFSKSGRIWVPNTAKRKKNEIDAYAIPDGCVPMPAGFFDQYLDQHPEVREKLEKGDRQQGVTSLCLARRTKTEMDGENQALLDKNQNFANDIMKKRIESDNLKQSEFTYAKAAGILNN